MHPLRSVLLLSIHIAATLCHFAAVSDAEKAVRVDPSGGGDFTTVQAAIDSVPNNNDGWTQISIKAGTYRFAELWSWSPAVNFFLQGLRWSLLHHRSFAVKRSISPEKNSSYTSKERASMQPWSSGETTEMSWKAPPSQYMRRILLLQI